jgi:hypothetical protein
MLTPTTSALEGPAKNAVRSAGLEGEDAPALGEALADVLAQALQLFATRTQVLPGIPAAVVATTGTGSTTGPGMLLPPPAGGPSATELEPLALAALQGVGLRGQNVPELAGVLADSIEAGLGLFCSSVTVAPGLAVAGFVTTAPGRLV